MTCVLWPICLDFWDWMRPDTSCTYSELNETYPFIYVNTSKYWILSGVFFIGLRPGPETRAPSLRTAASPSEELVTPPPRKSCFAKQRLYVVSKCVLHSIEILTVYIIQCFKETCCIVLL